MERQLILKEMDIVDLEMQKNYCNSTLQGSVPKCQYSAWLPAHIFFDEPKAAIRGLFERGPVF